MKKNNNWLEVSTGALVIIAVGLVLILLLVVAVVTYAINETGQQQPPRISPLIAIEPVYGEEHHHHHLHYNNTLIYLFMSLDQTQDVFDFDKTAINTDIDTDITTIVLIGDEEAARENQLHEDLINRLALHHLFTVELYHYNHAGELVVVFQEVVQGEGGEILFSNGTILLS